ncbi:MAG: SpoIIIAH-like family protein [Oscillospiraceae bacterium]|nr:SpoIIIAH-like family protein [Oscillospiraceae bacterium]
MKAWKRNLVIAAVLLFVCAGVYLNWLRGQSATDLTDTLDADVVLGDSTMVMSETDPTEEASLSAAMEDQAQTLSANEYFSEMRLSRQEARDSAVELLQQAMSYDDEEQSTAASTQLTEIVSDSLAEAQIESLVVAKGYTDCVAYMADDVISVAVAAPEEGLQKTDVALISDIVTSQTDYALADVRIIEVK